MDPVVEHEGTGEQERPREQVSAPAPERKRKRTPVRADVSAGSSGTWIAYALAILIPGTALAVGTVHVEVLLVAGAIAIAAGVVALGTGVPLRIRSPMRLAVWVALVLTGWTVIQAIPMPLSWVRVLAPANGEVWLHSLDALGLPPPRWATLSLDPGASWTEALKGVSYLGVMFAACAVAARKGASLGIGLVFVSALLCALATLVHGMLGLEKVFGLYEPHYNFATWHIGPFLNPNHLAGYLNLGAMCGLGLVLMRKPVVPPWMASIGVMLLIGSTITSASRGAVVLLPIGLGGLAAIAAFHARRQDARAYMRPARLLAIGAGAMGIFLAVLGITTSQMDELLSKDLTKLSMFSWGKPLIAEHKWVGIGRGAFETVFPAYNRVPGHTTFTHPENLIVQWIAEWGLVVGIGAGLAMAWALRPRAVGAHRSMLMASAWTGIVLLILQNLLDFSLELPSVGMAVALLVGSFWGDASRNGGQVQADEEVRGQWAVMPVAGGAAVAIWLLALVQGVKTPFADREAFFAMSKQPPVAREAYQPLLRAAILRHPAEPYFNLVAAERAWRMRDENPMPYMQRTFERAATYGRAHLLLAEILHGRALNQAMMELRLAISDDPGLTGNAVKTALGWANTRDLLWQVLPEPPQRGPTASTFGGQLAASDPGLSRVFDEESMRVDPEQVAPRIRVGNRLIVALRENKPEGECSARRDECIKQVNEHARYLASLKPESSQGAQMKARLLLAIGQPKEAAEALKNACEHANDRLECGQLRVQIAKELKDVTAMEQLLKQVAAWGCSDARRCVSTWLWIGGFNEGAGNLGAAVNAYEKAAERNPSDAATWVKLGNASSRIGAHARAVQAFERALARKPGDAEIGERLRQEKQKVFGSL